MNRIAAAVLMSVVAGASLSRGGTPDLPVEAPQPVTRRTVDFERHVAPLLSKLGCNAGSCHGGAEGQGGLKLSLFGSDMSADASAIADESAGRIDVAEPDLSLLLRKPTLQMDHEGGRRFEIGSPAYRTLRDWIAAGAKYQSGSGALQQLQCEPAEVALREDGQTAEVKVIAIYNDGSQEEVTDFCELRVQDESVARLKGDRIERVGPGDTHLIAVYRGAPASLPIRTPSRSAAEVTSQTYEAENRIDERVNAKLQSLGIEPSPASSDAEFLRRVTLITIGQLPTAEEVRAFLADADPSKRERQIDRLLAHPLHASLWATRMCEITGSRDLGSARMTETDREREWQWHEWFRQRFAANVPYDEIVRRIFMATTRDGGRFADLVDEVSRRESLGDDLQAVARQYAERNTLDLFWSRPRVNEEIDVDELTERISAAFLGVRIECARCHKHPFDRWTQEDHRSLANVFTQIRTGLSPESRAAMVDLLEEQRAARRKGATIQPIPAVQEVFLSPWPHDRTAAASDRKLPPRALGGPELPAIGDRRIAFAEWMTSPENPMFARNFVNRVWQWYFGRGLVEPVDAFSAANPPSHPRLIEELARDFAENGFDVRRLERQILSSRTWQRTSLPTPSNAADERNFARFSLRPLRAEAMIDAIRTATGREFTAEGGPTAGLPAAAIPVARTGDPELDVWFRVYQRPERKLTCDCEQSSEPTLRQTMLLLSDPALMERIRTGALGELQERTPSDPQLIEELFLRTLSRPPEEWETAAALKMFKAKADRTSAAADILWSLMNTREFMTLH